MNTPRKEVLVVGGLGNMGRRYQAILKHLNVPFQITDIGLNEDVRYETWERVIIATPTDTHIKVLETYIGRAEYILCEKPITTNHRLLEQFSNSELYKITMVNQYAYMCDRTTKVYTRSGQGPTYYDYFKSGEDGLLWDCINIIGLNNYRWGLPRIQNESPIWKCQINGASLSLADMDQAYIDMTEDWILRAWSNIGYAIQAHKLVEQLQETRSK